MPTGSWPDSRWSGCHHEQRATTAWARAEPSAVIVAEIPEEYLLALCASIPRQRGQQLKTVVTTAAAMHAVALSQCAAHRNLGHMKLHASGTLPVLRCVAAAGRRQAVRCPAVAAAARLPLAQRRAAGLRASAAAEGGAAAGQVSAELMESMRSKIADALEAQTVEVADVYGDGRHVSISVVASAFEGKSSVARQRMVYKAIWMELQEAVHAVDAMTTRTPDEAASA